VRGFPAGESRLNAEKGNIGKKINLTLRKIPERNYENQLRDRREGYDQKGTFPKNHKY